jgi:hypothetical protein
LEPAVRTGDGAAAESVEPPVSAEAESTLASVGSMPDDPGPV